MDDDIRERLRVLDRLEPPDLRRRLGTHRVDLPPGRRPGRFAVAAVALVLALGAVAGAYLALRGTARPALPSVVPALHPNGPIWFLGGDNGPGSVFGPSSVYSVQPDGTGLHKVNLPARLYSITGLAVAPDGGLVAVSNGGGEFPPRNIYVMRSDGTGLRQLTSGDFEEVTPAWSPDGSEIVFSSTRCCATDSSLGGYQLYTIRPDGSGLRRLTEDTASDLYPAWSPDGTHIAYVVTPPNVRHPPPEQDWQIWVVNAGSTGARVLTNDGRYDDAVTWSPDGHQLAYVSHLSNDRDWQIRVMRPDGTGVHTVFRCSGQCYDGGYTLAWSPDGTEIAFTFTTGPADAKPQIGVVSADGGNFHVVDTGGVAACCLSWTPADTTPAPAATAQGATSLAGVGSVCDLSQVSGHFLGTATEGNGYLYSLPESGACPTVGTVPAPVYYLGVDLGSGQVSTTYGPIDCRPHCVRMEVFAAADINGDGTTEIALQSVGADPIVLITIYEVVPGGGIRPFVVEGPGDPPNTMPGPLSFPWGGVASVTYGARCTDLASALPGMLVWKAVLGEDGQPSSLHEAVLAIDGTTLTVVRISDHVIHSYADLPPDQDNFCGASL